MGVGAARKTGCLVSGLFLAGSLHPASPAGGERIQVEGVVTAGGQPLAGALVRLEGGPAPITTGEDGRFALPVAGALPAFVTAGKPGFFNGRARLSGPDARVRLELKAIPAADDAGYWWQDPTPDPARAANCGNCHSRIYAEWSSDSHSRAAVNPVVLSMYNGTGGGGRANVSPGYLLDWSDQGNCASCHAPLAAVRSEGSSLNQLEGVEKTGVSCDFCHKVREVSADPKFVHAAEMRVLRPARGDRLIFGPLEDAMLPGDPHDLSYSPLFKSSRFCAGCHDGGYWGTPVYETYSEWLKSPYSREGVQCQECHMRALTGPHRIADEKAGGILRSGDRLGSHRTMSDRREELLRGAVSMDTVARRTGDVLEVRVRLANTGAGHHLPTGQPMRNMLLVVWPEDESGRALRLLSGERVPVWGGDLSGRPGQGFAKILATVSEYAKAPIAQPEAVPGVNFPAPFWRRNRIVSDNRIPARGVVEKSFLFDARGAGGAVTVTARLLYRRAFQQLAQLKGWKLDDLDLSVNRVAVPPGGSDQP